MLEGHGFKSCQRYFQDFFFGRKAIHFIDPLKYDTGKYFSEKVDVKG